MKVLPSENNSNQNKTHPTPKGSSQTSILIFLLLSIMSSQRARTSILDKPLSRGKGEVSLSCFALLFSEVVQYSQSRVYTVPELQNR